MYFKHSNIASFIRQLNMCEYLELCAKLNSNTLQKDVKILLCSSLGNPGRGVIQDFFLKNGQQIFPSSGQKESFRMKTSSPKGCRSRVWGRSRSSFENK